MLRIGTTITLLSLALLPALQAQSPELARISPRSARPGETVTVTLEGAHLEQAQPIWTSFGAHTEWIPQAPDKNGKPPKPDGRKLVGKLTLAADAPLGLGFIRLPTATGMSGPVFFLVDELPVMLKDPKNPSVDKAQVVKQPLAVEGEAGAGRSDFYRVDLHQGESLSVEVFAARIGSKMDPLLRLLDLRGTELAVVDDTPGLAGDCRLRYHAAAAGPLIIEIRDASFAGGGDHFYHLRIGDFPLVSAVLPPVAAPGKTISVRAVGEAVEGIAPLQVTGDKSPTGVVSVPVRFAAGKPAAFAYVRTDELPAYIKGESNDAPAKALAATVPCTVFGRIEKAGGRDAFVITAKKDERITLTPITREIGSPAVLYLGVDDDKGKFIAANDNPGAAASADMSLTFRAPADGACRISVEDVGRRGGADFVYGVRIQRSTPGFDLTVAADRFVAPRGGAFSTKVTVQRRAVGGPITLELASADGQPLAQGFRCEQNVIDKGRNDTQLKVTVPGNLPLGTICHVRIAGHAMEGGVPFDAIAAQPVTDPKMAAKDPLVATLLAMPQAPRLLCETFPICIGPEAPDFFTIELTAAGVDLPVIVGKSSFVVRQKGIDPSYVDDVRLMFEGLPPGIVIKSGGGRGGRIKGQVDFICEVTGPAGLMPGVHPFDIVASGDLKGVQKTVRLAKVPLRVIQPLSIGATVAAPMAVGGTAKLKITTTRYDLENPQPVEVTLRHLPAGIIGPQKVTIATEENGASVELAAEAGAVSGIFDSLRLAATTQVNGMPVSVESLPIRLEVRK